MEFDYLRPKEVAEYLRVSRPTLWSYVRQGRLAKPIKISSKCVLFPRSAIEDFLLSCAAMPLPTFNVYKLPKED
jgi:prophage regulatory protein